MSAQAASSSRSSRSSAAGEPPDPPAKSASQDGPAPSKGEATADASNDQSKQPQQGKTSEGKTPAKTPVPLPRPASTSFFWSSWISPSSSASAAASSVLETRKAKPRMTYEQYRAQEPPQARLLRLRGLFDKLMDADKQHALADGRAKDEWTKSAIRAQYGKYGPGKLVADDSAAQSGATSGAGPSGSGNAQKRRREEPVAVPPRQGYANELLTQCRKCREDLDRERAQELQAMETRGWWTFSPFGGGNSAVSAAPSPVTSDSGPSAVSAVTDTIASAASSVTSLVASAFGSDEGSDGAKPGQEGAKGSKSEASKGKAPSSPPPLTPTPQQLVDHDGEAGWVGSGVWGLNAVGSAQRELDREALAAAAASGSSSGKGSRSSGSGSKSPGSSSDKDGKGSGDASPTAEVERRQQRQIEWEGFLRYAEQKERELYAMFNELDRNGDMRLDVNEIRAALDKAGIDVPPMSLEDFIASLASSGAHRSAFPSRRSSQGSSKSHEVDEKLFVTFPEFRDYLLLLPRKPSVSEIFRFYQVRKTFGLFREGGIFAELASSWGKHERGASAVNLDGDVSLAGEEKRKYTPAGGSQSNAFKEASSEGGRAVAASDGKSTADGGAASHSSSSPSVGGSASAGGHTVEDEEEEDMEDDDTDMIAGSVAIKFLLAGGIAGAVSRTATAPFDRLKVYLITKSGSGATAQALSEGVVKGNAAATAQQATKLAGKGAGLISDAIRSLYREGGGLKAFWVGNGLNCLKIFPESAIKFLSYETSKRAFAKYVDGVHDSRDISGTSRFISGGIGGITSQLAIYPIETLKTRLMSSQGTSGVAQTRAQSQQLLKQTAKDMWKQGGFRTYYRGLTAGLIGVFPYSAIDMSTFEGIKLFYIKYTGKDEPGVLALLAFGSVSGSVGATTVYPLNLIRTRLQAAGTPAHPVQYAGFWDACRQTYRKEGYLAFYKGLVPTLLKVVPAVSISYVVYEQSKRRLGVHI